MGRPDVHRRSDSSESSSDDHDEGPQKANAADADSTDSNASDNDSEDDDDDIDTMRKRGRSTMGTEHQTHKNHARYSETEAQGAHHSKKARRSVTGNTSPPQTGLFIQNNREGQAADTTSSKRDENTIDKQFPSDAKPRLFHVIAYLVQNRNDKLHYVKLLFQHPPLHHAHDDQGGKKKNSPPPTWLAVRCLLQVHIAPNTPQSRGIRVLAIMETRGNSYFWHNCIQEGEGTERVLDSQEPPNKDLGYSFCLATSRHVTRYTKHINNIEYGSEERANRFVYTIHEGSADTDSSDQEEEA
jgi:hypothetical protein